MLDTNICPCCGGHFYYTQGRWKCRFCGSYKPEEITNEEMTLIYTASQKLRLADFYEAEQEFDDIVRQYPQNPYAYWGRLMAKYGIKYEDDYDGRRIPTCYAASIESIYNAGDYAKAQEFADEQNREFYREQADYIEGVRKEWIERARKEKPYDIFICYKDSDKENGLEHTEDSNAMMDLYLRLTKKGYRVFFSRVSLADKVGEKYEPYIFSALSTARVMLVYGSRPEYIDSAWVKNEWTRYGRRIAEGEKHRDSLLVACKGFSPSELPAPLRARQCFDAGKLTFFGELTEAVDRLVRPQKETPAPKRTAEAPHAPVQAASLRQSSAEPYARGLEYKILADRKSCGITGMGTCTDPVPRIPEAINGYAVRSIEGSAFWRCTALSEISIPGWVTRIGNWAFRDCRNLKKVLIAEGVTELDEKVFQECAALTEIVIPESLQRIPEDTFRGCVSLLSISFNGTKSQWKRIAPGKEWRRGAAVKSVACADGVIRFLF